MQNEVLTVVLGSPANLALTDEIVKGVAGEELGYIVERCRRGQVALAREGKRGIGVLEEIESEIFLCSIH